MDRITVYIFGDKGQEHLTFVESGGKYMKFHYKEDCALSADEVINFLHFLGFDVFEVICGKCNILDRIEENCVNFRKYIWGGI